MARIRSVHPGLFTDEAFIDACKHATGGISHLYVIQEADNAACKIGHSRNALWRLSDLRSGNHRSLYLRAMWVGQSSEIKAIERDAHLILANKWISGEWFSIYPECAVDAVKSCIGGAF
jgi:hypothetical protein